MSAKAKNKTKNNESTLAEAVVMAGTTEAVPPADPPAAESPPVTGTPVIEASATELPSKPSLLLRARLVTGKAVITIFSRVRTAQATAVQKSLAIITAADAGLSKSLLAGEQYVLTRLRVTPE